MSKYRNKKITIDGIKFDSKKEAVRYKELKILEQVGEIIDLQLQPKFLLIDKFEYKGKKYRAMHYIADFKYYDTKLGADIVEDVKGYETGVYKLKKKLLLNLYPDINFVEIK